MSILVKIATAGGERDKAGLIVLVFYEIDLRFQPRRGPTTSVQFLGSLVIKRHRGAIKASLTSDMTIMFENFEFHFCHSNKVAVCVSGDVDTAEQGILFRAVSVDI